MDNSNQQSANLQTVEQQVAFVSPSTSNSEKPFWQTDAFIVLLLVFFWPAGLILMWKYASWRKRIKTLLTLFFSASIVVPVIVFLFFAALFSNQIQKRNEFGVPPSKSDLTTQAPTNSKVYYFEDLGNGYTSVTSPKYKFSFEFPSDLKYYPPFGEGQDGIAESIGFHTEKRLKNDSSSSFFINFSPSTTGNPCESYKSLSNWSQTTVGGLPAVKSGTPDDQTIIVCGGGYNYSFSYSGAYTPKNEGALTPEESTKEKAAFENILQTFKITQ